MRRSLLPVIVSLLLCAAPLAEAQDIFVACNRRTIESFPGRESGVVLRYLDESRKAADEFVLLLSEGRFDDIYNLNKRAAIWVQGDPNVRLELAEFERRQGRITHFEYRNQEIVWQLATALDLNETVYTWYSVKTTNRKNGLVSLQISTHRMRDKSAPVFGSAFFKDWSQAPPTPTPPKWLKTGAPPLERTACPTIDGRLDVRAH